MRDQRLKIVKTFLDRYLVDERPIILAVSGGPDSLALLYLMLECRQFFDLDLHIAHVDHRLRKTSIEEANALKALSENLKLPFHLHVLDGNVKGNLEDWAREKRYRYFRALYQILGAQALMVGHHKNDQAETALKRVLEGAGLCKLGALAPETVLHTMRVWRPLLPLTKNQLQLWLKERHFEGFDDESNRDTHFLRARMRQLIFPVLEQKFGKNITSTLARIGERSLELSGYLARKTRRYFRAIKKTGEGYEIDLASFYPLEKIEVVYFLGEWAESMGVCLSHSEIETLFELLKKRAAHRRVRDFYCDRGRIVVGVSELACT